MAGQVGRKRVPLTAAGILAAAADLVEAGGPDALTMRALARRLGTTPMAFYNHFADREAIVDALCEAFYAGIDLPDPRGRWDRRLTALARRLVEVARGRPQLYRLCLTRPTKPAAASPVTAAAARSLADAGLGGPATADALLAIIMFLHGLILTETERLLSPPRPAIEPATAKATDAVLVAGMALFIAGICATRPRVK